MYQISCPFALLWSYQRISRGPGHMYLFRNKASFYGEELLAPRPYSKPEDHPLSTVRYYLFIYSQLPSISKAVHPQPEDAPCRADRDRFITDHTAIYRTCTIHKASQYDIISAHLTSPSFKTISLSLRILFNPKLKSSNQKAVVSLSLSLSLSVHISLISFPTFVQQHQHTCILHVALKLRKQQQYPTIRKGTKSGGALNAVVLRFT
jgi:hypothetical protein